MNITSDRYNYRNSGNNWEIDVYRGNKLLATIFCPNTGTSSINFSISSNPVIIDFSKLEDVKIYLPWYFDQNRLFFDENGKIKQKNLLGESEDPFSLGIFSVEYPNPNTLTSPSLSNNTQSLQPTPVTESISNTKGEVIVDVAPLNDVTSNNPYSYDIKPDFGYGATAFNSTQKGWKIFISYNGIPINFLPDGPLLMDLSRNYDEAVEFVENKIKKTGFTDSAGVNYPPFEPQIPKAIITAPGYETQEISLIKGDGTPKDLGVIQMVPLDKATEIDKIEASQFDPKKLEELVSSSNKTPEYFAQKKLIDLITTLKNTALPLAITLVSSFGITQAAKLIEKGKNKASDLTDQFSCPNSAEISLLITRKNQLVKQLNSALKIIDRATQILGITGNVINTLEIAFRILKNLPLPSSVPPGVGLPVNVILGIQDSKDTINKTITRLKTANTSILVILVIIRQILTQLLQYLSLIDSLIQECSPNTEAVQETVSEDLLVLTQEQSNQQSPVVINVNGFEMGVETEPTTNSLKRRRAIARNKDGVVMLKGEWSFSSIDQILIDELVFYIQVNNLKAD